MCGQGPENDGPGDGLTEVLRPDECGTAVGLDREGDSSQGRPSLVDEPDRHAHRRVGVETATPERRVVRDGCLHDVDEAAIVDDARGPTERHRAVGVGAPPTDRDDRRGALEAEHPATRHEIAPGPRRRLDDRSSTHRHRRAVDRVHGDPVAADLEFEGDLFDRRLRQFGGGQPPTRTDPVAATSQRTDRSGTTPGVLEQVDDRIDPAVVLDRHGGEHRTHPHVLVCQRSRCRQDPAVDLHDRGHGLTGDGRNRVAERRRREVGVDRHVGVAVW